MQNTLSSAGLLNGLFNNLMCNDIWEEFEFEGNSINRDLSNPDKEDGSHYLPSPPEVSTTPKATTEQEKEDKFLQEGMYCFAVKEVRGRHGRSLFSSAYTRRGDLWEVVLSRKKNYVIVKSARPLPDLHLEYQYLNTFLFFKTEIDATKVEFNKTVMNQGYLYYYIYFELTVEVDFRLKRMEEGVKKDGRGCGVPKYRVLFDVRDEEGNLYFSFTGNIKRRA